MTNFLTPLVAKKIDNEYKFSFCVFGQYYVIYGNVVDGFKSYSANV